MRKSDDQYSKICPLTGELCILGVSVSEFEEYRQKCIDDLKESIRQLMEEGPLLEECDEDEVLLVVDIDTDTFECAQREKQQSGEACTGWKDICEADGKGDELDG